MEEWELGPRLGREYEELPYEREEELLYDLELEKLLRDEWDDEEWELELWLFGGMEITPFQNAALQA